MSEPRTAAEQWLDRAEAHPGWRDYKRRNMEAALAEARRNGGNFITAEAGLLIEFATHLDGNTRQREAMVKAAAATPPAPPPAAPAEQLASRQWVNKQIEASITAGARVLNAVRAETDKRIRALVERIDQLAEENALLKASAPSYRGVWDAAVDYRAGSMVTQGGSMWFARSAVPAGIKPGSNPDAWQLAVKKGRDAR